MSTHRFDRLQRVYGEVLPPRTQMSAARSADGLIWTARRGGQDLPVNDSASTEARQGSVGPSSLADQQ